MRARRVLWLWWGALLGAALLLLAQSCSGPRTHGQPDLAPESSPPTLELWVDASGQEGGDGSAAHPLRRLELALAVPAPHRRVHLAPGLYPGPFTAPDGTELVGGAAAVLTASGAVTVLTARGAVSLSRLFVQGGTLGISGEGNLRLADVRFSGQRVAALAILEGATLVADTTLFEATLSGPVGLLLSPGARAQLVGCTFEGPFGRAVEARSPAQLRLWKSHFRGAVTALHLRGGSAELSDVTISEGRGPGLYVVGGTLDMQRVQVSGHEYGLLTGTGAAVEAEDFTSTRADRAGVGVVNAKAHFLRLTITQAGTFGGLQTVSSDVRVEALRIEEVAGLGVSMREGTLRLDGARVVRTREPDGSGGDALQLRGGKATLKNLTVRDAGGACVVAAEGADVLLSTASLEHCHTAGLVAESGGHLSASTVSVQSSDGPGAVATGDGELVLLGFRALATDGVVWAECAGGAQVKTFDVGGLVPSLPCIEELVAPPPP